MLSKRPIGLLDSGVGGFTVLNELKNNFPHENFVYFGDSKHMPYGERDNKEIIHYVDQGISFLEKKDVKSIVLACNTASSLINSLKSEVKLFSIIEAGCRAILDFQDSGPVGLIATRATVKNGTYQQLIKNYNKGIYFIAYGTPNLARVIENQEDLETLRVNIRAAVDPILAKAPIKSLLLGCTHYPIVSKLIKELYPGLSLIDPAKKQAEILKSEIPLNNTGSGITDIFISGSPIDLKRSENLLKELDISHRLLETINI